MTHRFTVLLALVGVAASVAAASPAQAAFPGANGLLAFDYGGNIYTANPDGTNMVQLTTDGQSVDPAWSANGGRIAFTHRGFIFVMTQHGKWPRKVTRLGHSSQPAWSPDGKQIAFTHGGEIWVAPSVGGSAVQLTHDVKNCVAYDGDPTWSPLGGTIAYSQSTGQIAARQCTGEGGNARIVVLRLKSGVRNVIANAWSPDFTADGRGLVFQSEQADPNDPTSRIGAPQYESSDLTGEPRFFYSRAWCAESAPCLTDVVAAPTSTLENPQGLFIAEVEGGLPGVWGYCVTSADAVNGTDGTGDVSGGWCEYNETIIDHLAWQPLRN